MGAIVTYGRVVHGTDGRGQPAFGIRAVPHVAQRLKRVFARADAGTPGVIFVRDTLEVARDLAWFMDRWPLTAADDLAAYIAESTVVAYYMTDAGTDPLMAEVLGIKRQQSVPIRRPDAALFAGVADSTERARRLAANVLQQISSRSPKGPRR